MKLAEIERKDVDRWILAVFKEKKWASSTVNKLLMRFRTILDFVVLDGLIPSNPAKAVRPVKLTQKDRGSLTMDETILLLQESRWDSSDFKFYVATVLGATCGLRLSEIPGLLAKNVHPDYIDILTTWKAIESIPQFIPS